MGNFFHTRTTLDIGVTWWGGGGEANAPPIFFTSRIRYFFGYWVEEHK